MPPRRDKPPSQHASDTVVASVTPWGISPGGAQSESLTSRCFAKAPARLAMNLPRQSTEFSGYEVALIKTFKLLLSTLIQKSLFRSVQ